MNKHSSYRMVDVLTTDTWLMSYEIGVVIENVGKKCPQKCVTIYHHT